MPPFVDMFSFFCLTVSIIFYWRLLTKGEEWARKHVGLTVVMWIPAFWGSFWLIDFIF
jgi:hypothetical protein